MEIKTCEEYVLDKLNSAEETVDILRTYVILLANKLQHDNTDGYFIDAMDLTVEQKALIDKMVAIYGGHND